MKKVLSIVLSLVMVICMMPVMAFAATSNAAYSDISGEKCEGAVNVLDALGVVDGYEDGTYRPDQTVTRAEMAKLIITALGVADYASATNSSYSDMALAQWAIPYVEYATNLNIVEGVGGGRFSPGNPVTYEQAATMIVRALGFTDECNEMNGTWPAIYVQKATALGLFNNVSNGGSTGANRGDIAVMLYNALTVPEVYADNDGQTNKKVGSDGGDVTMMDTLNVNGSSEYKIVTNADADTAVNSIAGYVGAAAEVIYNQDGDVLALSDIKTTFLTGKYKSNGKFEADNGTTYSIATSDAYKVFSDKDKGTVTSAPEDGVVTVVNNISSDALKKFADTDADNTFTVAATVSGKTITGIYSIGSWTVSARDRVDSSDISQIERNQKLLSKKFPLNDDQEIDTGAFILNGVDSLDKIEADNVVYVYEGDGEITRVDVGTETVTGTISKKSDTKVTIDGTGYEFSDCSAIAATSSDLAAGNEVTLYLDYAGDIYDAELVDGTSGNFAVVVAKSDDKPSSSAISGTAKVELLTADGDKVFEINGKKYEDNSSLAWANVTVGKLVKYSVNDSGQITKLTAVEDNADYEVQLNKTAGMNITKAGYLDGHSIADSALIFAVPTTSDPAFDYSDSDDLSVVKKSSVLDTTLSLVSYVVDKDTNRIVCMIMDDSATSEDTYGIVTSTYEIDGGDGADFYIGSEKVSDGEVDSGTPATVKSGAGLFKITKTTSGAYKFEKATAKGTLKNAPAYEVKNDYVQLTEGGMKYNLYGSAVVYVYDKSEDEYSIGTASDMTDDDVDSIELYQTSTDTKDDDYGLVNYIVITMK